MWRKSELWRRGSEDGKNKGLPVVILPILVRETLAYPDGSKASDTLFCQSKYSTYSY